ncbi:hypothetical protein D3C73_1503140 [compost metagenome]
MRLTRRDGNPRTTFGLRIVDTGGFWLTVETPQGPSQAWLIVDETMSGLITLRDGRARFAMGRGKGRRPQCLRAQVR